MISLRAAAKLEQEDDYELSENSDHNQVAGINRRADHANKRCDEGRKKKLQFLPWHKTLGLKHAFAKPLVVQPSSNSLR